MSQTFQSMTEKKQVATEQSCATELIIQQIETRALKNVTLSWTNH